MRNYECTKQNSVTIWIRRVREEEKHTSQSQVSELCNRVGDRADYGKNIGKEEEEVGWGDKSFVRATTASTHAISLLH